jgi:hypothetical protein
MSGARSHQRGPSGWRLVGACDDKSPAVFRSSCLHQLLHLAMEILTHPQVDALDAARHLLEPTDGGAVLPHALLEAAREPLEARVAGGHLADIDECGLPRGDVSNGLLGDIPARSSTDEPRRARSATKSRAKPTRRRGRRRPRGPLPLQAHGIRTGRDWRSRCQWTRHCLLASQGEIPMDTTENLGPRPAGGVAALGAVNALSLVPPPRCTGHRPT